jgi:hypothetical protein
MARFKLPRRGYLLAPIKGDSMPSDALGVCENAAKWHISGLRN